MAEKGHGKFQGDVGEDVVSNMPFLFTITELPKKSQYLCSAPTAEERDGWVNALTRLSRRGDAAAE